MFRKKSYPLNLALIIILTSLFLCAGEASAVFTSESYRIYDSVMYSFDGPAISSVSATAGSDTATITWTTDVIADSFVLYDTDPAFSDPKEQGSSVKSGTSQSVTLSGLSASTLYYYKVKSTRINGGVTIDSTLRNFTTTPGSGTTPQASTNVGGGGGILIIDKQDKFAPAITDIEIGDIGDTSAVVSWKTDEDATAFVEHGPALSLGQTVGSWNFSKLHTITLTGLTPNQEYFFKVISSDASGNIASSTPGQFKTRTLGTKPGEKEKPGEKPDEKPGGEIKDDEAVIITPEKEEDLTLEAANRRLLELLSRLSQAIPFSALEATLLNQMNLIRSLSDRFGALSILSEPKVSVGTAKAGISWNTNRNASAFIAISTDEEYKRKPNEYTYIFGYEDKYTTEHVVELYGLKPDTLYHYQLRNKNIFGSSVRSKDYTFRSSKEVLDIQNYVGQIVNDNEALFKWITTEDADSMVRATPYRGDKLMVEEAIIVKVNSKSKLHEILVKNLEGGVVYDVDLTSIDNKGNTITKSIERFTTGEDKKAPVVSLLRVNFSFLTGDETKIQAIVTWKTNEPATGRIYYQEGVFSSEQELIDKTVRNENYTRDHAVVITNFKPGSIYSIRAESVDSNNNRILSKTMSILVPRQKESIFQMIVRILESMFGWVKQVGR